MISIDCCFLYCMDLQIQSLSTRICGFRSAVYCGSKVLKSKNKLKTNAKPSFIKTSNFCAFHLLHCFQFNICIVDTMCRPVLAFQHDEVEYRKKFEYIPLIF